MIEIIIEDEGWRTDLPEAEQIAETCFDRAVRAEPGLTGEIALLLTSNNAIEKLNTAFRNQSKPTNVLSFPCNDDSGFIGDIAMAREICVAEAQARKISLHDHAAHLIIHGMLHLIGYDHQNDKEAHAMELQEIEILETLNVANPYALDDGASEVDAATKEAKRAETN